MYPALKHSHMLFIAISILLFHIRFLLKIMDKSSPKFLQITPHINDTLLLVTGIALAYMASLAPMEHTWLLAKIIALFVYIAFGAMALRSKGLTSILGYVLAIMTFAFIVLTAIKKVPFMFTL
ncbi:MAG: SirB2 family protein [Proteobacteria bacterium]|nr:SirB2 family protein [Pseudomonadota bacterium]